MRKRLPVQLLRLFWRKTGADEVGLLYGHLGPLAPREAVLGYVVLPVHLDPAQPMDIYWNDRRLTATLRP